MMRVAFLPFFKLKKGSVVEHFYFPLFIQVARAGRFGTKGLAVTFVSDETDAKILNDVQDRFEVNVAELPEEIDISTYSKKLIKHSSSLNMLILCVFN